MTQGFHTQINQKLNLQALAPLQLPARRVSLRSRRRNLLAQPIAAGASLC
jgi:hypothetical protein